MSILGEGSFAEVVGPIYSNSTMRALGAGSLKNPPYIVKIYKSSFDETSYEKVLDKQGFYNHLDKKCRHKSIIFPLATLVLRGKDIQNVFPFIRKKPDNYYQIEIEKYGGMSMEKIVHYNNKKIFSVHGFLKIWRCIPDILEDCFHVMFDNNLIMTDIKIENMVISPDKTLRLIDVDININNTAIPKIITPYIRNLPPQYFSNDWWSPSFQKAKKNMIQVYKSGYQDIHNNNENKLINSILDFIHNYKDPYLFIRSDKLTKKEKQFQRLFFVAYPLFTMILLMIVYQCVDIRTVKEKTRIKSIVSFCLDFLKKRGHFSNSFSYNTFQHFLWKMKSL